ncbi:helix-turn-helix transcriptional regulator [Ligilactobacillus animalis]|uniref:Helix-turn-helix transcriptional regulator n=1 Tax=Ligilactobacillus animalis TaxID=1605 RepID=A0AAJ6FP11_9LACO|nr:helix-turn-helix transcriptional regulator [Ligilactobacillus animalis]WHQ80634.1 helix-turn-helix transcriptional regulator [Ligilactobacillus animalis]
MARTELTPQDIEYKKIISSKLQSLLQKSGKKQIDITRQVNIPATTLTGYFKGTRLPSPENVEKLAKFFNVENYEIDPRFKPVTNDEENKSAEIEDMLDSAMTFDGKPLSNNDRNVIRGMIEAYLKNKE